MVGGVELHERFRKSIVFNLRSPRSVRVGLGPFAKSGNYSKECSAWNLRLQVLRTRFRVSMSRVRIRRSGFCFDDGTQKRWGSRVTRDICEIDSFEPKETPVRPGRVGFICEIGQLVKKNALPATYIYKYSAIGLGCRCPECEFGVAAFALMTEHRSTGRH